jgi:hypothetical protein
VQLKSVWNLIGTGKSCGIRSRIEVSVVLCFLGAESRSHLPMMG